MYLQQKHKQFTVRSYAKYIIRKQVTQASIEKFHVGAWFPRPYSPISIVWTGFPVHIHSIHNMLTFYNTNIHNKLENTYEITIKKQSIVKNQTVPKM